MAGHLLALAVMQIALWLLARMLRRPLTPSVMVAGLLLPHAVLAPWFLRDDVLLPTIIVQRTFPGAPRVETEPRHAKLNDSVYQFVPWEIEVRRALAERRLPLWSDRIDGGSSPWANPQAEVLSPVKMLARLVPVEDSLLTALALKMLIALQGTWLAARLFGASEGAALLAGGGFALGGGIVAWGLFPHTSTVAWAPWLLAAVLRLVRQPRWVFVVCAALVTSAIAYSGHPELAVASGLLAVVCGLTLNSRRGGRIQGVGAAALAAALGIGLAAPHVLAFVHTMSQARRVDDTKGRPLPNREVFWNRPQTWCVGEQGRLVMQPANPIALGRPYADPPPSPVQWPVPGSVYSGLVVFAGAVAALALRRRYLLPLAVFGMTGMVLAMQFVLVERVLRTLPGVRFIVVNRVLPVVALCLCILAAVGLTRLSSRCPGRPVWVAALTAAAISLAIARPPGVLLLWLVLVGGLVLGRWNPRLATAVLGFVMLLDLVPWAREMLPVGRRDLFYPPTVATAKMALRTAADGPWRIVAQGTAYYPSSLSVHGLEDVRFHNPLAPKAYARLLGEVFDFHARRQYFSSFQVKDHPLLDFLNVRVVAVAGRNQVPRGLRDVRSSGGGAVRLATNPGALRRFFVAPAVTVVPAAEVVEAVVGLVDPRRVVVAAEEVGAWRPQARQWVPRAVRVEHLAQGDIDLRLPRRGEKVLSTSLTVPEGWVATSNGRRLKTLRINSAFLGVVVPSRIESVRLRFVPPGLRPGLVLCAVSIFVLTAPAVLSLRRNRRKENPRPLPAKIDR